MVQKLKTAPKASGTKAQTTKTPPKTPAKNAAKTTAKKAPAKKAITKEMLIGEIVQKCPESAEIMFKHGLHCLGCGMVAYESLEQGSQAHGLSEQEIDKMVKEINELLKK